jgi:small-conductance mechanosensitive channel
MRRVLAGLALALALALPALPQDSLVPRQDGQAPRQMQGPPAPGQTAAGAPGPNLAPPGVAAEARAGEVPTAEGVDYAAWGRLAQRAEAIIAGGKGSNILMESLRAQMVEWRGVFVAAQGQNSARIATLRGQIDALGPPPADGTPEAEDIAERRKVLTEQLVRLQAPVVAAEEAYSRADGLVREIDRILRERQTDALMRLLPMPVNPANWPEGVTALAGIGGAMLVETRARAADAEIRAELADRLPTILALLLVALALLWRGRRWFERLPNRLYERAGTRGQAVWALFASLGQILVPTLGVLALTQAMTMSGLLGPLGRTFASGLTVAGFILFAARWLGFRVFPKGREAEGTLRLSAEDRRTGRVAATALGLLLAFEGLRALLVDPVNTPEAAQAVIAFPGLVLAAVALFRIGLLLRTHAAVEGHDGEGSFRNRMIGLAGRGAMVAAVAGPALAAVGYVAAGAGLVYPAAVSLGLIGTLFLIQRVVADIFALIAGEGQAREALLPALIGFALTLAALPVFALIWGARWSDITELVERAREGFAIGTTRISPTVFFTFVLIFGAGFLLTRLFQGALKSTILPRTRLDPGGQNAMAVGAGYVGIFLSALVAINTTGLDLSGLAIVAGALSVGIGFGLQQIVSNFVSGIILLIERPVSEGDWIEVGPVSGIVKSISVRSTRIQTFDRSDVIVPNSDLITRPVTNWTRFSLTGRLVVPVTVALTTDSRMVERILREIVEAQPLAVMNPAPLVLFTGFAGETMTFEVRVILRDVNASPLVRSEINHEIARRFAEAGIEFTHQHRDFLLRQKAEAEALALEVRETAAHEAAVSALLTPRKALE